MRLPHTLLLVVALMLGSFPAQADACLPSLARERVMAYLHEPPAASDFRPIGQPQAREIVGRLLAVISTPAPFATSEVGSIVGYTFRGARRIAFFSSAGCLLGTTAPSLSREVAEAIDGLGA